MITCLFKEFYGSSGELPNGVDLYTVQKLGRWKTVSMVMRYAHHYPESLRSGINVMDKTMSGFITILSHHNEKGATVAP